MDHTAEAEEIKGEPRTGPIGEVDISVSICRLRSTETHPGDGSKVEEIEDR